MMSKRKKSFSKLMLAMSAILLASTSVAQITAHDLVDRMFEVSKRLNYSGVFSYEANRIKRNVKVSHQVLDGYAYERISYLDRVVKDQLRKSLLEGCSDRNDNRYELQQHYRFNVLGEYRVAGRQAYRIQVLPIDNLRYGFLFGVDKLTGLMLQSSLLSHSGRMLENFEYVDIQFESKPATPVEIRFSDKFAQVDTETCGGYQQQESLIPIKWVARWVPPGFVRSTQRFVNEDRVSLFYTDGISVFSVLIDDSPVSSEYPILTANVGPTKMMMASYRHNGRNYRITVSGQMPQATVRRIISSVRPMAVSLNAINNGSAGQ